MDTRKLAFGVILLLIIIGYISSDKTIIGDIIIAILLILLVILFSYLYIADKKIIKKIKDYKDKK